MTNKRKRFVIFCQARSGSTLLRLSLHAHPRIVCHGEVLSREWINGLVPVDAPMEERSSRESVDALLPERAKDPIDFLERYIWRFDCDAVGFKLVLEDLFKSEYSDQIQDYFASQSVTPIILYRRDQLANYVSRVRMVKYRIKHRSTNEDAPTETAHQKIDISLETLERFVAEQRDYLSRLFNLLNDPLLITYEDLRQDYPGLLARLGVAPHDFTEKLVKTSQNDLSELVHHYDSLRASGDFEINLS